MRNNVVHGDITSDYGTTKENVASKVGAMVETIKSKYGYKWGDFIKIIHIADTDGAFIQDLSQQMLKIFNIMRITLNILILKRFRKEIFCNRLDRIYERRERTIRKDEKNNHKNHFHFDSSNACSNTGISVCTGILCC